MWTASKQRGENSRPYETITFPGVDTLGELNKTIAARRDLTDYIRESDFLWRSKRDASEVLVVRVAA